jgi:hypothetical protein
MLQLWPAQVMRGALGGRDGFAAGALPVPRHEQRRGGSMKRCIGGITLAATCVTVLLIMSTAAMANQGALTEASWASSSAASHLDLVASYQVCAFSASRHSIARGESVRLRGRVPMIPSDRELNDTMALTLFKHAGVVGQPWTWRAKGWTKVATIRTDFHYLHGRFSKPYLHPRRTTSYVIRFPRSFDPSWRGFTSVETVHVH